MVAGTTRGYGLNFFPQVLHDESFHQAQGAAGGLVWVRVLYFPFECCCSNANANRSRQLNGIFLPFPRWCWFRVRRALLTLLVENASSPPSGGSPQPFPHASKKATVHRYLLISCHNQFLGQLHPASMQDDSNPTHPFEGSSTDRLIIISLRYVCPGADTISPKTHVSHTAWWWLLNVVDGQNRHPN